MSGYGFRRNSNGNVATGDGFGLMRDHMVLLGDYGHGIGGPFSTPETDAAIAGNPGQDDSWRERPEALAALGPAGMLEQDDGENWGQSTRGTHGTVAKNFPLHFAMGMGHGEIIDDEGSPPRIETHVNEHARLWYYRGWADWMAAPSWADLRANHTPPPMDKA